MKITGKDSMWGKYEISKNDKGYDRIKFGNDERGLNTHSEYGYYFIIDNPYVKSDNPFEMMLTDDNMKQMIQALRDGYCDTFESGMFGGLHPIRFLMREQGEKVRQKTLEGWSNTTDDDFKYIVKISSGFSSRPLMDGDFNTIYFDTVEEAQSAIVNEAKFIYNKCEHLEGYSKKIDEFISNCRVTIGLKTKVA